MLNYSNIIYEKVISLLLCFISRNNLILGEGLSYIILICSYICMIKDISEPLEEILDSNMKQLP